MLSSKLIYNPDSINTNGCEPFTDYFYELSEPTYNLPVFVVDRGSCTFVTKARNAQNAGALAVIVINDKDENIQQLILSDDGTGSDVQIPVILINNQEGEIIKKFFNDYKNDKYTINRITANIEHLSEISETIRMDLFFTADNPAAYKFLRDMGPAIEEMGENIELVPNYIVYRQSGNLFASEKDCIGNKKFCYIASNAQIEGRNVVIESLYQKCIYKLYGDKKSPLYNSKDYYGYIETFSTSCLTNEEETPTAFTETCREKAAKVNDIEIDLVENCIAKSYDQNVFSENIFEIPINSVLDEDYERIKTYDVRQQPSLYINRQILTENLIADNAVKKACLMLTKKNPFCESFLEANVDEHVDRPKKKSRTFITVIIIIIIIFNILIFFLCRKYLHKQISEKIEGTIDIEGRINNTVSKYFQLQEKA